MGLIDGVPPLSANEPLRFIRIIYMGQAHKSNRAVKGEEEDNDVAPWRDASASGDVDGWGVLGWVLRVFSRDGWFGRDAHARGCPRVSARTVPPHATRLLHACMSGAPPASSLAMVRLR